MNPELSIIIPTYNETDNIKLIIDAVDKCLGPINWEIIFVDDDSPDNTSQKAKQYSTNDYRVRCITRIGRKGLSSACIEGMLSSSSPYLAVMDADLQHDETLLPKMLHSVKNDEYDIAIASRYIDGGSTGTLSPFRRKISVAACKACELTTKTKLSDPMSGFFLLKRSFFEKQAHKLYGKGFKILLDIVSSSDGNAKFIEMPYTMKKREFGDSKLDYWVILEYFALLLLRASGRLLPPRFILFAFVGVIGTGVHLTTLGVLHKIADMQFIYSQIAATIVAMTSNFIINNNLTFKDKKLYGKNLLKGLFTFYVTCSFGAFLSTAVAEFFYQYSIQWWVAGSIGIFFASVWNFTLSSFFTWGQSKENV